MRGVGFDQRSVVYNLGAILHHALTGAPPFAESTPELVRKAHLFEEVPHLACNFPDLSGQTIALVLTAMRKSPTERHADLDAFVAACDRALAQLGVTATGAAVTTAVVAAEAQGAETAATAIIPALGADPFAAADAAAAWAEERRAAPAPASPAAASPSSDALEPLPAARAQGSPPLTADRDPAADVSSRILAKHAALKAGRAGLPPLKRTASVVSQSFLAGPAPRMEVVIGIIIGNGWVPVEGQKKLRDFFNNSASTLLLRMRGGISNQLVSRGILPAELAGELDATIADQLCFPQYRLTKVLGKGPVGRTYAALRLGNGETVAIKIFRQEDPEKRRRFLAEFASMTRLRDPLIASALECGSNGEICFAASDLVPGEPLARLIEGERTLSTAYAIRLAQQVVLALQRVHARTARLHLALKPQNILVVPDSGDRGVLSLRDRIALTDFGMSEHVNLRQHASWRAPEVATGGPGDLRADIYAVGAILQRLVSSPAGGEDRALPPALKEPNALLGEVLATATHRNPDKRYQDHAGLLAMLAHIERELAHQPFSEPEHPLPKAPAASPAASLVASSRVLRRNHAVGPKGDATFKTPGTLLPGLEQRPRTRPVDP